MESSFNIYKITSENDNSSDPEFEDYFELNDNFTHLTNLIRLQYFAYLKRIITQNYTEWKKTQTQDQTRIITDEYLEKCAAHFEERAVRYCMVVQLYRKYMLRTISEIRHETTCCELISKLKQCQMKCEIKQESPLPPPPVDLKKERSNSIDDFPKAACKRKLEKTRKYSGSADDHRPIKNAQENTIRCLQREDSFGKPPSDTKEQSQVFYTFQNGENENLPKSTDYQAEVLQMTITPKNALVPYGSDEEDNSQPSPHNSCNNSPNTSEHHSSPKSIEVPYESLSLNEKIKNFKENFCKSDLKKVKAKQPVSLPKRKREISFHQKHLTHRKLSISHPISPVSTSSEEETLMTNADPIAQDLEDLFGEDKQQNDIDDIFGDGPSYNPEIELILREIENSKVPGCENSVQSEKKSKAQNGVDAGGTKSKRYKLQTVSCDLRQSLWPCELHMWKQRLREALSQLADENIRHHDQIRDRFFDLFGADSEDEFAPYSPSLELDEILISSCMTRIAPIIVKYLMHPLKQGLIANRYLFKKLAKKLSYNTVISEQYADEDYIKEQIDLLFCSGRKVESLLDIETI